MIETSLGRATELSLDVFFERLLPPLVEGLTPEKILTSLKTGTRSFKILTKQDRWRGFARDPKDSDGSAYHTFKPLETVVKAVAEASGSMVNKTQLTSRRLRLENKLPELDTRHQSVADATFPDASFLEGSEVKWETIAVCGAYQKERARSYVPNTIVKVTDLMANCMIRDFRRRFVFGFTMQNDAMRFWFYDRSKILTSQPFNFITDHLPWIHFCLSILYAKPHQLGWDTSMILLQDGENFDISVRSEDGVTRTYRTQAMLSAINARNRLEKGTKVWRAVRVEDGEEIGPPVALKDYWVYPNYAREGNVIQRLRQDASKSGDDDLVTRELVDVYWHGDVFVGDDDDSLVLDCTQNIPGLYAQQLVHNRLAVTLGGHKSIDHETSLPAIYGALASAVEPLRLMHEAGWVHRDISSGNILIDSPRLVDFEFAKDASERDDFNLGTLIFKSFEVDQRVFMYSAPEESEGIEMTEEEAEQLIQSYLSRSRQQIEASESNSVEEEQQDAKGYTAPSPTASPPPVPFHYNPLHDLEALWWVAVYFLLKREVWRSASDPEQRPATGWDREKQREWAEGIFYGMDYRCPIMMTNGRGYFYSNVNAVVHPKMRPVVRILDSIRQDLVRWYIKCENDLASIDYSCAQGLYERFSAKFSQIKDHPQLQDVYLVPLGAPPTPESLNAKTVAYADSQPKDRASHAPKEAKPVRETRNGSKTSQRAKSNPVTPGHHYNLRPRPKRSS
ncbi:hypothetical protein EIP86_010374 [Pleurotus ostreatoroseus]|nr:hypothetical protein EIP86_010374 [Pleurotus ostreatoroseus]